MISLYLEYPNYKTTGTRKNVRSTKKVNLLNNIIHNITVDMFRFQENPSVSRKYSHDEQMWCSE